MTDTATAPEKQVAQHIRNGQIDKAVELLCELALTCAQEGDIEQSEGYRDRLYELDGLALAHIVRVNEAIDDQKSKFLTPDYRCQWAPFFEKLSSEEANLFFFALKTVDVGSEKEILRQGRPNDKLFLIHQGRLKVVYRDQDKDMLICNLGACDIFGQDTFFSVNVSTATIKTLSPVHLSYIDRATLERIRGECNFSEANLKEACTYGPTVAERLKQKGLDRRSHKRFKLRAKLSFSLLSVSGKPTRNRAINAELWDLSKGGLSFYFSSKNQQTVRNLIGHTLGVKFKVNLDGQSKTIALTGVVQGVASHPMDEYSVHLKLDRNFSDAAIKAIQASV